jgi:hypothetical protein
MLLDLAGWGECLCQISRKVAHLFVYSMNAPHPVYIAFVFLIISLNVMPLNTCKTLRMVALLYAPPAIVALYFITGSSSDGMCPSASRLRNSAER